MNSPEDVDLATLAALARREPAARRAGFVVGRTNLRDCFMSALGCSAALSEQLVDTMVARGFLEYAPDARSGHGVWLVHER